MLRSKLNPELLARPIPIAFVLRVGQFGIRTLLVCGMPIRLNERNRDNSLCRLFEELSLCMGREGVDLFLGIH